MIDSQRLLNLPEVGRICSHAQVRSCDSTRWTMHDDYDDDDVSQIQM